MSKNVCCGGSILKETIKEIECNKNCHPRYIVGPEGKQGPAGKAGPVGAPGQSDTIEIGKIEITELNEEAKVYDTGVGNHHILNFILPKGKDGENGVNGEQGPEGQKGQDGAGVTILGAYEAEETLLEEHAEGSPGDSYLVGENLYVWNDTGAAWTNVGPIKGPQGEQGPQGMQGPCGPKGDQGPKGVEGPYKIRAASLVTFSNNNQEVGIEIRENERLPIKRKELDTGSICELDSKENTIQFNKEGYYKISFIVNARTTHYNNEFDPLIDFVSIGFKLVGTNDVYVGDSQWIYSEKAAEKIVAQGIITVTDIANAYELVNLSKRAIYLITPDINNINTRSYFINAPVNIMVEYLGR